MGTKRIQLSKANVSLTVDYNYNCDIGSVKRGIPPTIDIELRDVNILVGNFLSILNHYNKCDDIINEIKEQISNKEW